MRRMNFEDQDRMDSQKRHFTILGCLVLIPLGLAHLLVADTDEALIWGMGAGVGLAVAYALVQHLLEKRRNEDEDEL